MPIVVLLLVVVIVVVCLNRGDKGAAGGPALSAEERELRRLPDETVQLFAYLRTPTPAQKAEYVRRHGEWPGYTADDFAEFEEGARKFKAVSAEIQKRYEQEPDGTWVPKSEVEAPVVREERSVGIEASRLRGLSEEAIDLMPYLASPSEEEKAEYVRRRGTWPGHLPMDEAMLVRVKKLALAKRTQSVETEEASHRAEEVGWVPQNDGRGNRGNATHGGDDLPDFRPAN